MEAVGETADNVVMVAVVGILIVMVAVVGILIVMVSETSH
jgi:hypothetical protein